MEHCPWSVPHLSQKLPQRSSKNNVVIVVALSHCNDTRDRPHALGSLVFRTLTNKGLGSGYIVLGTVGHVCKVFLALFDQAFLKTLPGS